MGIRSWMERASGVSFSRLLLAVSMVASNVAADPVDPVDPVMNEFLNLDLQDLLSLEVSSVARRSQRVSRAAAAVFVITNEDIRRSGVTSIPEALRMAPGVQVARIDANKWAITSRGFNGRFANKLLVLMDGRSLYTPTFSGVYWDVQDTLLEDIERIEVIRGPGATLWGANAVNGVINIISKSAGDTQGSLLSAGAGNEERGFVGFRHGAKVGNVGHYRVYGKYFNRDGNSIAASGESTEDGWDALRAGFRADLMLSEEDDLSVQGDIYTGQSGETVWESVNYPPYGIRRDADTDVSGFNLVGRWSHWVSDSDDWSLQAYYDHTKRDWSALYEKRNNFDLDFQYRTTRFDRHNMILGLGYRYSGDSLRDGPHTQIIPSKRDDHLLSAFIQDDIELSPHRWMLTLGSKFEHNDYTGFEIQPNVRLLWTPNDRQSIWGSIARAVRTPGRADDDADIAIGYLPPISDENPSPLPVEMRALGSDNITSERLIAYELGYKWQASPAINVDLALFYNDYSHLRSSTHGQVVCLPSGVAPECLYASEPPTSLLTPVYLSDQANGETYGYELAADWRVNHHWRLKAAYSFLQQDTKGGMDYHNTYEAGVNPRHQLSLRSLFKPRSDWDLDVWLRYVDGLDGRFGYIQQAIDPYWELDVRAAWRPYAEIEFSLVGQNLLDNSHPEFLSELGDIPLIGIERSVYAQIRWAF